VAHEFKQPLSAMMMRADTGYRWLDRPTPKAAFQQITADGHRAGAVIESIQASLKQQDQAWMSLDVNELIEEPLALTRDELQRHWVAVRAEPNTRLPQVTGDRVQLQQVLLNLITNAIEAMADGDGARILSVSSDYRNGDVVISVADAGNGIQSEDVHRVFNPLFTTKPGGSSVLLRKLA
jgi:C4-dicarboxylate-specific signal transduction histidine kinase